MKLPERKEIPVFRKARKLKRNVTAEEKKDLGGGLRICFYPGDEVEVIHQGEVLKIKFNGMNGARQAHFSFIGPHNFDIQRRNRKEEDIPNCNME